MRKGIIIHASLERKEYFFSTDHCQGLKSRGGDKYPQDQGFVPVSYYLPLSVVPRPEFPDGTIRTLDELIRLHHSDEKEIPNPDPRYQPKTLHGEKYPRGTHTLKCLTQYIDSYDPDCRGIHE